MSAGVQVQFHFCGDARSRFAAMKESKVLPLAFPVPVTLGVGDRVSLPGFDDFIFAVKNRCFYFDDPKGLRIELFIDIEIELEPEKPKLTLVKGRADVGSPL